MACILSECWFGGQDVRGGGRLQLQGARQHHSTRQAASLSLCGLQRLRHSAPRQAAKVWPPCGARWVPQRRLPLSGAAPFSTAQTPRSSSLPRHPSKPKVDPKPSSPLAATPSAGGCRGQPRQHQLPHPRRERPLHPQGCAPSSACPALCGWSYSLPCRSVAVVGRTAVLPAVSSEQRRRREPPPLPHEGTRAAVSSDGAPHRALAGLPAPPEPHNPCIPPPPPPLVRLPAENITCLTRLDHNRALGQLSERRRGGGEAPWRLIAGGRAGSWKPLAAPAAAPALPGAAAWLGKGGRRGLAACENRKAPT